MGSLGDFASGCTLFDVFTTVDSQGRPAALGGNPKPFLVAFKDAFAESQCTKIGFVLSLNCNGRTGVNTWSLNTNASPTFYACGHQYQVLLEGGCVDSLCVSGYVVGRFSLNQDSSLKPLIHGRNRVAVTAANEVLTDPCSTTFSVRKLLDPGVMTISPCSTIFSVQKLLDPGVMTIDPCSTIFSTRKLLDPGVMTIDPCSVVFSVRKILDPPVMTIDPCSTIFSTRKLLDPGVMTIDPCSVVFSVRKVLDPPVMDINPCSAVYSVEVLSNSAVAKILDTAIAEPTTIFAWASATLRNIVGWLGAVASNRILQEAGQQGVCNRAATITIAKASTTDDGTTATRGSFT